MGQPLVKSGLFVIIYFPQPGAHDLLKNGINAVDHSLSGSEILIQGDQTVVGVFIPAKAFILTDKDGRVGQPKAVNTLLNIADHKIIIIPDNLLEDRFLHFIGVLIFVQKNIAIAGADLIGDFRVH